MIEFSPNLTTVREPERYSTSSDRRHRGESQAAVEETSQAAAVRVETAEPTVSASVGARSRICAALEYFRNFPGSVLSESRQSNRAT